MKLKAFYHQQAYAIRARESIHCPSRLFLAKELCLAEETMMHIRRMARVQQIQIHIIPASGCKGFGQESDCIDDHEAALIQGQARQKVSNGSVATQLARPWSNVLLPLFII